MRHRAHLRALYIATERATGGRGVRLGGALGGVVYKHASIWSMHRLALFREGESTTTRDTREIARVMLSP